MSEQSKYAWTERSHEVGVSKYVRMMFFDIHEQPNYTNILCRQKHAEKIVAALNLAEALTEGDWKELEAATCIADVQESAAEILSVIRKLVSARKAKP